MEEGLRVGGKRGPGRRPLVGGARKLPHFLSIIFLKWLDWEFRGDGGMWEVGGTSLRVSHETTSKSKSFHSNLNETNLTLKIEHLLVGNCSGAAGSAAPSPLRNKEQSPMLSSATPAHTGACPLLQRAGAALPPRLRFLNNTLVV